MFVFIFTIFVLCNRILLKRNFWVNLFCYFEYFMGPDTFSPVKYTCMIWFIFNPSFMCDLKHVILLIFVLFSTCIFMFLYLSLERMLWVSVVSIPRSGWRGLLLPSLGWFKKCIIFLRGRRRGCSQAKSGSYAIVPSGLQWTDHWYVVTWRG